MASSDQFIEVEESAREDWLMSMFVRTGALRTHGHFVLNSGLHSVSYVDKDSLTYDPSLLHQLANYLVFMNARYFVDVSLVISPASGAILFGGMVAHQIGCSFAFTEKDSRGNHFFRPSFLEKLDPGNNVLIVEDVVTKGTTIKQIVDILESLAIDVNVQTACIWDRSTVPVPLHLQWLRSVVRKSLPEWDERECILCREGREINTVLGHGREFLNKYGSDPMNWPANNSA